MKNLFVFSGVYQIPKTLVEKEPAQILRAMADYLDFQKNQHKEKLPLSEGFKELYPPLRQELLNLELFELNKSGHVLFNNQVINLEEKK